MRRRPVAARETPIRVGREIEREFPGSDRRATASVVNLVLAENLVTGELSRLLRRHRLTPATFNVLMILRGAGRPLCPHEIGERRLVTRGTVTGLLDSLERQGLVRRTPHPEDGRSLLIEITDKAGARLERLLPAHYGGEKEMLSCLTAAEKDMLVRLLGKIQGHLEARREPRESGGRGR
ncbi:MAG: MarR family transcriptional regulator [Acidobacteria bacterium]|nr:MarR family transcriptional regulator [Acidobacteriota bacterium]